jgi:CheY-like chemotaxis protein
MRDELLVIDDDEAVRVVVAESLQEQGFVVVTAADAVEGLRRMQIQRPDLVLLDLMLPGVSGWQMLDEMQRSPSLADVPVIVLTGLDSRYDLPPGRPTLHKPVDSAVLAEVVRSVLHPGRERALMGGAWRARGDD